MGIELGSQFDVKTGLALDSRLIANDLTERDAIPNGVRYEGMLVYVVSEETNFQLIGGILNSNWEELSGGTSIDGEPIDNTGEIMASARDFADPPANALPCNGSEYDAEDYPALAGVLWDIATSKWKYGGTGTYPTGTFFTPALEGQFLRGTANASTLDPHKTARLASGTNGNTGNNVGSKQASVMEEHRHGMTHTHGTGSAGSGFPVHTTSLQQGPYYQLWTGGSHVQAPLEPGPSSANINWKMISATGDSSITNTAYTGAGTETRPTNVYVNFFILHSKTTISPRGSQLYVGEFEPSVYPPEYFIPPQIMGDKFLQEDGTLWDFDGTDWIDTTVNIRGPTGLNGGIPSVPDYTSLEAYPAPDRYEGMIVYVVNEGRNYQLVGGTDNSNWIHLRTSTGGEDKDDVGTVEMAVRDADDAPVGTLLCDGTLYDAQDYPLLAERLWDVTTNKYKYGGNGTFPLGEFNVPKMNGVFARGADLGAGFDFESASRIAAATGGNTGDKIGSYQVDAYQHHKHGLTDPGHFHSMDDHNHAVQYAYRASYTAATPPGQFGFPSAGNRSTSGGQQPTVNTEMFTDISGLTATQSKVTGVTMNNTQVASTGGTPRASSETHPKNITFNFFIRFEPSTRSVRGSQWYTGSGDPNLLPLESIENDKYLDEDTGSVWEFDGTDWVVTATNLRGPIGLNGGIPAVPTLADLDLIDPSDRYEGMLVYVEAEEKNYQLIGGIDDADWTELKSGGGGVGGQIFEWRAPSTQGAMIDEEFDHEIFVFPNGDGTSRVMKMLQVPPNWEPGDFLPRVRIVEYHGDTDNARYAVTVSLIRPDLTSDINTAIATATINGNNMGGLAGNAMIATNIALTNGSYQVNTTPIQADDFLKVELKRISTTSETTLDSKILKTAGVYWT